MIYIIVGLNLAFLCFGVKLIAQKRNSIFYDGRIIITKDDEGITRYSLLIDKDLDILEHKKSITFMVTHASESDVEIE